MMITNGISGLRLVILLIAVIHCITGQRKWSSWSRYSQCSVTCGQGRQRRQRYCIKSSSSSSSDTCAGPKEMYAPCQMLACPQEKILPCNCGCTMQKRFGLIVSQLPSRETKSCEWRILVKKGSKISLNVTKLVLKAGWVRVASGKKALLTLLKPGPEPKYPWRYLSDGNIMTLELLSYPDATGKYSTDTYLAAQYREITAQKKVKRPDQRKGPTNNNNNNNNMRSNSNNNNTKSPNVTAIIGITACVVVIVLVAVFLAVRRHRKRNQSEAEEDGNEAVTLHSEYDPNGKPRGALNKEEKPLMDPTTECDRMSPPHGILMKPSASQGRESAYESDKGMHQTYNGNAMARLRYPPEYYINTPTYVHDPSFIRMLPVTTASQAQQQVMQPIVLQSPRVDS